MAMDLVAVQLALLLAGAGTQVACGVTPGLAALPTPAVAIALAVSVLVLAAVLGLHDAAGLSPLERFRARVRLATMLPWLGLAVTGLQQPFGLDVVWVLCAAALLFVPLSLSAEAFVRAQLIARSSWGADAIVIGNAASARRVADDLLAHPETGLRPIGTLTDELGWKTAQSVPHLGLLADVEAFAGRVAIAVVVLSRESRALDFAKLPFRRIVIIPDVENSPCVIFRTRAIGGIAAFDFPNPAVARSHHRAKRALDLLVAVPALFVSLPIMLSVALALRVLSPGPVFFVQNRVGLNGRPVAIYKIRSMYLDAEHRLEELLCSDPAARREWETYVKLARDPRVVPVLGNFIRRLSIDELPQLWNVIRGDLSLVGPRPFPSYHLDKFSEPFQKLRCSVPPGLTGLWQISVRSTADLIQQEGVDTFYIRNYSLWLDLYIVLRTLPAILVGRGAQ